MESTAVHVSSCLDPSSVKDAQSLLEEYLRLPDGWWGRPVPEVLPPSMREELESLSEVAGSVASEVLVAYVDTTPVGVVVIECVGGRVAELRRMFVRESSRGAGVGKCLLQAGVMAARSLGCERVRLDIIATREDAIRFYHREGFARADVESPLPLVFMELELS